MHSQSNVNVDIAVAKLHGRVCWGLTLFRKIAGLTAVSTVVTPRAGTGAPELSPPVHPRCARGLRAAGCPPPCGRQWAIHIRSGSRSGTAQSHTCPIGLRCSWVPIQFHGRLVGVTKLVVGPETSRRAFDAATQVLDLIVSGICQESLVFELSREVADLRRQSAMLRMIQSTGTPGGIDRESLVATRAGQRRYVNVALVERALSYLHHRYRTPALSLVTVAEALGCNPRYLTTRFTSIVGERMHAYLVRLRVAHACRLLIDTDAPIKQVAFASGFRGNTDMGRAFRRHIGVSAGKYRAMFVG